MTEQNAPANSGNKRSLVTKFAERFDVEPDKLLSTLTNTAFQISGGKRATNEQMMALLIVADQHGLNPFTKEIYAFEDRHKGIVPIVGVDGWARIINEHPEYDGMEFEQDEESCTCRIYRKDRNHPTVVTEWLTECRRDTGPWKSHPRRMLRHKAMIQCARLAFSFAGIYDPDEGERIREARSEAVDVTPSRPLLDPFPDDRFDREIGGWRESIQSGQQTAANLIAMLSSRYALTDEQAARINDLEIVEIETVAEGETE